MANAIQFWITRGNERLRLPVNPEMLSVSSPFGYEDVPVSQVGEITVINERLPKDFSFSSFFPRDYNESYCEYSDIPKPWDAVKFLEDLRDVRKPVRLTITGTPINTRVLIRDLQIEPERAGNPGDIYFTIMLKEYTDVAIRKAGEKPKVSAASKARPSAKPAPPKSYTVKSGDTLWKIAQKYYGDGSKLQTIYNANKKVIGNNPNVIKPGQKLVIPNG